MTAIQGIKLCTRKNIGSHGNEEGIHSPALNGDGH